MGRRLVGTVPIHEKDGTVSWYGPDDDVPADVAKKIGDHAWVEEDDDADGGSSSTPAKRPPAKKAPAKKAPAKKAPAKKAPAKAHPDGGSGAGSSGDPDDPSGAGTPSE